jgi:hypothetical protein
VSVDEIESLRAVRTVPLGILPRPIDERKFKRGLQSVIGERGRFTDWGGERNDLWTTRVRLNGRRRPTAFAFKGKGASGKLTIAKMGKNGDQIPRLFKAPADLYVVQYWRDIDEAVVDLVRSLAVAKSVTEAREIAYCIVDGQDSQRLIRAYPQHFERGVTDG